MLSSGPAGCVAVQRRRGEGPVLSAVGREKGASTIHVHFARHPFAEKRPIYWGGCLVGVWAPTAGRCCFALF